MPVLPFGWVFVVGSTLAALIVSWLLQTAEDWDQEATALQPSRVPPQQNVLVARLGR